MKILVIGASGQVGKAVMTAAAQKGHQAFGTSRRTDQGRLFLDLSEPGSVKNTLEHVRPELVVLCSAMTHVDGCERDQAAALQVNVKGPELVARECLKIGARVVYLSTEYVFDGRNGPYSETDAVHPISVYGRTKLAGEQAVLGLMPDALSIRTTVVYSYDKASKNFIMQLISNHNAGVEMKVPADQYSNPTYAPELADFILRLAAKGETGIYNVVGADLINRYEFALKACKIFGFKSDFLKPVSTAELAQPAPRPLKAGLKTDKLLRAIGEVPAGVEKDLKIVAENLK